MPHRNRVIVIDDKTEDGEAIVTSLRKLQIPSFFLHYDEEIIAELDSNKRFEGIRFIFQDIALVSPDFPGRDDYAAAAAGINRILADKNGPWLLIAWSTWGDDPENGDKYAKELFEYLVQQLPLGKRPYQYAVIDKRPYSTDGEHGAVKVEFDNEEKLGLIAAVEKSITPIKSLDALTSWEANIRSSASQVLHNLWGMIKAETAEDIDKSLGGVLFQLAIAQEGSRLKKTDNLASPLYQILSNLVYDKISHVKTEKINVRDDVRQDVKASLINTMLHWEENLENAKLSPGCVYRWPSEDIVNLGNICISTSNIKEFVIDAFVADDQNKKREAKADIDLMSHVELVLLDITPACDHANDKAFWRRFLVGIKVDEQGKKHFYTKGTKLAGDYLKDTPEFSNSLNTWRLVFNSKLIVSLTDKNEYISDRADNAQEDASAYVPEVAKLIFAGRIREQLWQEFIAWFGGMATRPGIVSLK